MRLIFLAISLISLAAADVAIIGGGLAGISAALELQKNGVPYTLLEASDRLGGRVLTIYSADEQWIYQLGALDLFVQYNDGLYDVAVGLDIINSIQDDQTYPGFFENAAYGTGGRRISDASIKKYQAFIDKMETDRRQAAIDTPAVSQLDFYNNDYAQFFGNKTTRRRKRQDDSSQDDSDFDVLSSVYKDRVKGLYAGGSWDELALINFRLDQYPVYKLDGEGFGAILKNLTGQLNMNNVRLNSPVTSIDYSGPKVKILVANQPLLQFDQVIVTVSLGVLKNRPTLFTPSLPVDKTQAINDTGYGSVQRVIMEFKDPFWNTDRRFLLTPFSSENTTLGNAMKTFDINGNDTLEVLLSGNASQTTAQMSPSQLGKAITDHLRIAFNNQSIQEPANVYTRNWFADSNFFGSSSYQTPTSVKAFKDSIEVLASSLPYNSPPRVFFAGEHTHSDLWSKAEGAFQSGRREAKKIVQLSNKQRRR